MPTFNLPDLGEGLSEAEILEWNVTEGQHIVTDQPLLTVETDKAVVEIPAPYSGEIVKIYAVAGDVIGVGKPLCEFDSLEAKDTGAIVGELEKSVDTDQQTPKQQTVFSQSVRVSPAVRALAQKLGLDLTAVLPTGKDNTVTRADVENAAKQLDQAGPGKPLHGKRRAMANRMVRAHSEIVPATVTEVVNVGNWSQTENITVKLIKGIASAAKQEPSLNAWYFSELGERRLTSHIDVGIAVDTEDGLIVPVLRNIETRKEDDLLNALKKMRSDVKERLVKPNDLKGATITLSNFGMIGGVFASLVVVPPQVAIVGAGRIYECLELKNNKVQSASILPLSLTFDHRVVTGGEAVRFLSHLKSALEQKLNKDV